MSNKKMVLNLCESTINTLHNVLNYNIPKELNISLNQKLFLLEAALNDFKEKNIDSNSNSNIDIKKYYLERNSNNLKKSIQAFEKDIIKDAIAKYGSKRKAATALKVDHSTLIKKCQRYGI